MPQDNRYVNIIANSMFTDGSEATSMVPWMLLILIAPTSLNYM